MALACGALAQARSFESWKPLPPGDLAKTAPASAPDAPAEALLWKLDVDDSDYPQGRQVREYIRYKIYDPEKAASLTRIAESSVVSDGFELGAVDFLARLTLPDGTAKEFTKKDVQERSVAKSAADSNWLTRLVGSSGTEVQEKFLAVPGIVPGAILEIQFFREQNVGQTLFSHILQKNGVPVDHVEYVQHIADTSNFVPRPFLMNGPLYHATLKPDVKRGTLTVVADDLPPLYAESLAPPALDRALAVAGSYVALHSLTMMHRTSGSYTTDKSGGAWANLATRTFMIEKDTTEDWGILDRQARKLTAGLSNDLEKAKKIHAFVHERFLDFLRSPRSGRRLISNFNSAEPDVVLEFEKHPEEPIGQRDFLWLAIGLFKSAGLKTQTILLPDNNRAAFDPSMSSDAFLPDACARVSVGGNWMFSYPDSVLPLPLGALPPANVGRVGLIAQVNKTEFIPVPAPTAEDSTIRNTGSFELDADGSLSGNCTRIMTGMPAYLLKGRMRNAQPTRRAATLGRLLKNEFKADRVQVTSVEGIDDPDAPLRIRYSVAWTDYATVTKSRLIFVPTVFQSHSEPLFGPTVRHYDINFPYPFVAGDSFTFHLPDGYKLEAPSAPPSAPGPVLSVTYHVTYTPGTNTLGLDRTHLSQLTSVGVSNYANLKKWFDREALLDSHEIVLVKTAPPAPAAAPEPAPPPPAIPAKAS